MQCHTLRPIINSKTISACAQIDREKIGLPFIGGPIA